MRRSIAFAAWVAVPLGFVAASDWWREWWRFQSPPPVLVWTPVGPSVTVPYTPPTRCWWSDAFVDAPGGELSEWARGELARVGLGRREISSVIAP
jgi:hypothetical protein